MKLTIKFSLLLIGLFVSCIGFKPSNFSADFQAIVISDTHISNDESKDHRLAQLIEQINSHKFPSVELLLITGDLVAGVYGNSEPNIPDESNNRIKKLQALLGELKIPYYLILGNHDYRFNRSSDSDRYFSLEEILQTVQIWNKDAGIKPYYAAEHQGWKFICLNSMRGRYLNRYFDDEQLSWFEQQFHDGKPTILLFHHPVKTNHFKIWCKAKDLITPEKEPRFFDIVENHSQQIKAIFVGHGHRWVHDRLFSTIKVYETDSFGESKGMPFYLVGFDNHASTIHIEKFKTLK